MTAQSSPLPTIDPYKLGRRVVHINLSDLAAMGANPRYAVLSLTLPQIDEAWIKKFSNGLWSALDQFGVELIGGNTTRGPLAIALTAMGEVPPGEALLRNGARAGDELWVSGSLGDAGWALYCLIGDIKAEASASAALTVTSGSTACSTKSRRPCVRTRWLRLSLRDVHSCKRSMTDRKSVV